MIAFRLDTASGLVPYLQLVQQVKHALRLGILDVGDQLPTVKEVVATLAINPNTVLKAYRELEHAGLIESRPGQGTFVLRTLAGPSLASHARAAPRAAALDRQRPRSGARRREHRGPDSPPRFTTP